MCVTGLRRFGIQDPSPPKALFTRVLKVPTAKHFAIYFCLPICLLPPSKLSPNIKRFSLVPKRLLPGSYLVWHRSYWSANEGPPPQTPAYPSAAPH